MSIIVHDNTDEILDALSKQIEAGLEAIGNQAVSHAKNNITKAGRVGTDALRNSVTHEVAMGEKAVYIGTNLEYAPYHELGTGIYADSGKGRKGWWVYVPGGGGGGSNSGKSYTREQAAKIMAILRSKGIDAHMTQGIKPIHFLKRAGEGHTAEYRRIAEEHLKK